MHVVHDIDDGAENIDESLQMLKLVASQGVTDVFCTSHNGYSKKDGERYLAQLSYLKNVAEEAGIDIRLHKGSEALCEYEYMDDIIHGLDTGAFSTLGDTQYVLTELHPDTMPSEALMIIKSLTSHGYKPIIAHMERNYNITHMMVRLMIQSGALIQVNTYSFVDETTADISNRARSLLHNKCVHFIGSDAHGINRRAPKIDTGVKYIMENADKDYALQVICGNAHKILGVACDRDISSFPVNLTFINFSLFISIIPSQRPRRIPQMLPSGIQAPFYC